ncbi:MAG: hypothetical protein ABI366_02335, partial [Ginsengibacter sp.]
MKKILLSLTTLLLFFAAKAQTADDIIAKHIDAIGGKEKLSQITSINSESTTEIMGNEASSKTTILNGKGYKNVMDFNGQQIVQVVTDKGGWAINPFGGSTSATAITPEQYKSSEDGIYFDPLYNYAERDAKVELEGQEKVGDINAYKIKYTNKDSAVATFFIDPATNYIIKTVKTAEVQGQPTDVTISYSDFKKTDFGIVLPHSSTIDMGQFNLKNTTTKVEINKEVDPSIFD